MTGQEALRGQLDSIPHDELISAGIRRANAGGLTRRQLMWALPAAIALADTGIGVLLKSVWDSRHQSQPPESFIIPPADRVISLSSVLEDPSQFLKQSLYLTFDEQAIAKTETSISPKTHSTKSFPFRYGLRPITVDGICFSLNSGDTPNANGLFCITGNNNVINLLANGAAYNAFEGVMVTPSFSTRRYDARLGNTFQNAAFILTNLVNVQVQPMTKSALI